MTTITPKKRAYRARTGETAAAQAQIQFRISTTLRDRLFKQAARRGVSVNYLIERALEDAMPKWEKQRLP